MGAITPNMAQDLEQIRNRMQKDALVQLTEITRRERIGGGAA